MADRALGEGEPGEPREVFELDKDERWQARLEEARARREIALRDKAAGRTPPRPKPWEEEGQAPIEPIIQERGDDKFDFADRLEQLKGDEAKESAAAPKPAKSPGTAPAAGTTEDDPGTVTTARKKSRPPAGEAMERLRPPDRPKPPTDRPPAGEAIDRLIPPDPAAMKARAVTPVRAEPAPTPAAEPPRRTRPAPSLVIPGAPDVAEIAKRYAETLKPDFRQEPLAPAPAAAREPETDAVRAGAWTGWRLPDLSTRPGVRPLGMALGLLALSALPLTTVAPPLEKGPPMPVIVPFPVEPALGVTWSLYAKPVETRAGEWRAGASPGPLALPEIEPPAALQGEIAMPAPPQGSGAGAVDWSGVGGAPAAGPVRSELGVPEADPDRPGEIDPPPPPDEGASLRDVAPAPARPALRAATESAAPAVAPPASPLRVTILMPPRADKQVAEDFAADVPRRGHELVRIREVDYPISTRNLRYFHESDRAEAARLAREYGAELRDFTWFRPSPVEGTTELWLSGSAGEPATTLFAPTRSVIPDVFEIEPLIIQPQQLPDRNGALIDRVMEGVGNMLGAGLGLPRRGN